MRVKIHYRDLEDIPGLSNVIIFYKVVEYLKRFMIVEWECEWENDRALRFRNEVICDPYSNANRYMNDETILLCGNSGYRKVKLVKEI